MKLDHVQVGRSAGLRGRGAAVLRRAAGACEVEKPEALRAAGGAWFGPLHVGVEEPFAPARKAHPALRVDAGELDVLAARLAAAGVHGQWDDAIPGVRRFFTVRPVGEPGRAAGLTALLPPQFGEPGAGAEPRTRPHLALARALRHDRLARPRERDRAADRGG